MWRHASCVLCPASLWSRNGISRVSSHWPSEESSQDEEIKTTLPSVGGRTSPSWHAHERKRKKEENETRREKDGECSSSLHDLIRKRSRKRTKTRKRQRKGGRERVRKRDRVLFRRSLLRWHPPATLEPKLTLTVSIPTSTTYASRLLHSSPRSADSPSSLPLSSLSLSLLNPATQSRHITWVPCCSVLLLRASSLHRPAVSEHPVPSLTKEREREKERDIPLSRLFPLALSILVLRRSLVSQRWALPNYRLGIHNRTRSRALTGRYTCMVIACFIERGMKDDAEREREREKHKESDGRKSILGYANGPVANNLGYLNRR